MPKPIGCCPTVVRDEIQRGLRECLQNLLRLPHPQLQALAPVHPRGAEPNQDAWPFYFVAPAIDGLQLMVLGSLPELGSAKFEPLRGQPSLVLSEARVAGQGHGFKVARAMLPPVPHGCPWFRYVVCAAAAGHFVAEAGRGREVKGGGTLHEIIDQASLPLFRLDFDAAPQWLLQLSDSRCIVGSELCEYIWSDVLSACARDPGQVGGMSLMGAVRAVPQVQVVPVDEATVPDLNARQCLFLLLMNVGAPGPSCSDAGPHGAGGLVSVQWHTPLLLELLFVCLPSMPQYSRPRHQIVLTGSVPSSLCA